ncbi:angiopoietin-4-like [Anopheles aquasalis]|uniref:angiopoietin-4-like n=1 Tax=Anopheles aquasalis TaxID=42839 RepID=UPI00215A0FEE|nr:angiopoietin-4-like [Anopheles aquasalis]
MKRALLSILLVVAYSVGLCDGSFSLLTEPRQTCTDFDIFSQQVVSLTTQVQSLPTGDPLVKIRSDLVNLLASSKIYKSCDDIGPTSPPGLYRIQDGNDAPMYYYCETVQDGGRWTVIQRRTADVVNFTRSFNEYATGFGHPSGDFWLGLTRIQKITSQTQYELLIKMSAFDGTSATARYSSFQLNDVNDLFKITSLGNFTGDAGNSMSLSLNRQFSTQDKDTDASSTTNCANVWGGGWWLNNCGDSNLNGFYRGVTPTAAPRTAMVWAGFKGLSQSLKNSTMLIRKYVP